MDVSIPQQRGAAAGRLALLASPLLPFIVGAIIRFIGLDRLSIWLDEGTSIMLSKMPVADILTDTLDSHPPLYHLLLHYWLSVSDSVAWVRGLSALFGCLTILAIYALGRALFGRNAGLIAAWLLALSPWHVWYSQEARMYAAACLMAVLSLLCGVLWLQRRNPLFALAFVVATVAGLYLEYTFFLLWPAEAVLLLWLCRKSLRPLPVIVWLLLQAVVAAALLPLAPFYQAHSQLFLSSGFLRPRIGALDDNLGLIAVGLIVLGLLALGGWLLLHRLAPVFAARIESVALLLLLPLSIALMLYPGGFLFKRVLLVLLPLAILGIAWALEHVTWPAINLRSAAALSAVALVVMFFTLQKEQWYDVTQLLTANMQPGDVVLIEASYMATPFNYYTKDTIPSMGLGASSANATLGKNLAQNKRAWLILAQDVLVDPQGKVQTWFDGQYKLADSWKYYAVQVRLYDIQ